MVVDTSAVIAVLLDEPESQAFSDAMEADGEVLLSTATGVEILIVATGKGDDVFRDAVEFLNRPFIHLIPLDEAQMRNAADAFRRYGKGRHPAGLNFGDTFSYSLASTHALPLLFKGSDFARTDVPQAASLPEV